MLAQGAEAIIEKKGDLIVKDRIKKDYRIPEIDEKLRRLRTNAEARILKRLEGKVNVPKVISSKDNVLEIEFIDGPTLKEVLDEDITLARKIGEEVAKLHDENIAHQDLTTSNMILREGNIIIIDFGLAFHTKRIEDRAVDIHLFKQALESKHHKIFEDAMKEFFKGYNPRERKEIINRYKEVELRGRNKAKY